MAESDIVKQDAQGLPGAWPTPATRLRSPGTCSSSRPRRRPTCTASTRRPARRSARYLSAKTGGQVPGTA